MKKGHRRTITPEEIEEIKYRHRSVKEILTEMKDISEKIVDLAYSALIFDSKDMAEEVETLEYKMDKLLYEIRLAAMLAARTVDDANQLSGILQVASAAESMSNAAGDIGELLDQSLESRVGLTFTFQDGDEKIRSIVISPESSMRKKSIGALKVESETGTRIIALKRGSKWVYDIEKNIVLKKFDTIIVRGVEDGLNELEAYASSALKWGTYKRGGR
ncbi:MAG: potassium transporter TrkA [Thermoplasmata archaeon]|nr:MAG: potassium transporter TrkA [Thermoplasmata archaeon]